MAHRKEVNTPKKPLPRIIKIFLSKKIWVNVVFIAAFLIVCFLAVSIWMKMYSKHGQKIELNDFQGMNMEDATQLAGENDFQIVVTDSVHIIGKEGGEILNQNPKMGAKVKKGRKIYVSTSKYNADEVTLSDLPSLYGKNFERKQKELKIGYKIDAEIAGYTYDPGPENYIMTVIYEGDTIRSRSVNKTNTRIEKGGKLEFILSEKSGGKVPVPDLRCKTFLEARFILSVYKLEIGDVQERFDVVDKESSFIWKQDPIAS